MKLDLDILTSNLKEMAGGCIKSELDLRPYYLGIPFLAKLQTEYGAIGITVSSLEDILELISCGITDFSVCRVLDDYEQIIELSLRVRILITIDETTNLDKLAQICERYNQCIEILVNYHYDKDYPKYRQLIEKIQTYEQFDFAGIQAFNPDISDIEDYFDRFDASYEEEEEIAELLNHLEGIQVDIVTGLATPTALLREEKYFDTSFTECQAGEYLLMRKYNSYDLPYKKACSEEDDLSAIYLVDNGKIIDTL